MADDFGIRAGEVAISLPEKFDAEVYFIGRVCTPWTRREECPKNARQSDAVCTIDVDPRYAAALQLRRTARHICAALAGTPKPDCGQRRDAAADFR